MSKYSEKWKQIKEYPDYVVSNQGRIRSLHTGGILKAHDNDFGYLTVTLYNENMSAQCYVHRLVAKEFVPNKDISLFNQVNHIDGNKKNNDCSNLEWVTAQENKQHAVCNGLIKKFGLQKSVAQMDLTGNVIAIFKSATEAARVVGVSQGNISNVCRGYGNKRKDGSYVKHFTAGGYKWKYV